VRERTDKLVRKLLHNDPAPFVPLVISKRGKQTDYDAKAVTLAGQRYIVCRNHQEADKDGATSSASSRGATRRSSARPAPAVT
jgi:hypothetical protein